MSIELRELLVKIRAETGGATKKLASFGQVVTGINQGLQLLASVSKLAFRATIGMVNEFTAQSDGAIKTARALGMTTSAYQELSFAAQRSGSDISAIKLGLTKLGSALNDAAIVGSGKTPIDQTLAQLGLTGEELRKVAPEKRLLKIADAMKVFKGSAEASALAAKLFGVRAGPGLANLLFEGADGIETLQARARELGIVMDEDVLVASEKYVDSMLDLKSVIEGVKGKALGPLIPVFSGLVDKMTDWLNANRQFIALKVEQLFAKIQSAVPAMTRTFRFLAETVGILAKNFFKFLGFLSTIIEPSTLAKVIGIAGALTKLTSLVTGLRALIAAPIFNPWLLGITAVVAGLGLAAVKINQINKEVAFARSTESNDLKLSSKERGLVEELKDSLEKGGSKRDAVEKLKSLKTDRSIDKVLNTLTSRFEFDKFRQDDVQKMRELLKPFRQEMRDDAENAKNLALLKKEGAIADEQARAIAAQKRIQAQFKHAQGLTASGGVDESVRTEELLKLIDQAARGGRSLDGLLAGRKIEGGVPPVITVTNRFFNLTNHVDIQAQGGSSDEVVSMVMKKFNMQVDADLRRAVKAVETPEVG